MFDHDAAAAEVNALLKNIASRELADLEGCIAELACPICLRPAGQRCGFDLYGTHVGRLVAFKNKNSGPKGLAASRSR